MTKSLGYDLNDAYFYVKSTVVSNVARFGTSLPSTSISIFTNNDFEKRFTLGVKNNSTSSAPVFFIGYSNQSVFQIDAVENKVNIGSLSISTGGSEFAISDVFNVDTQNGTTSIRSRLSVFNSNEGTGLVRIGTDQSNVDIALYTGRGQSYSIGVNDSNAFWIGSTSSNAMLYLNASCNATYVASTLNIFPGNMSNMSKAYTIGVSDPLCWIGRGSNKMITLNDKTNCVGIGTSNPKYAFDVHGDMHLKGLLIQEGSNLFLTNTMQNVTTITESISAPDSVDALYVTSATRFASNVYVEDTLYASNINIWGVVETVNQTIYNSERIVVSNKDDGPAMEVRQFGDFKVATFLADGGAKTALDIDSGGRVGVGTTASIGAALVVSGSLKIDEGVSIQQMGDVQRISACVGQVPIVATGTHQMGFVFTWDTAAQSEREMIECDVTFYGSGYQTRTYLRFGQFINPVDNGMTLPSGDIMTDYKQVKYKAFPNIRYVKNSIVRAGSRSVQIKIEWCSDVATNYNVNLKIDMLVPKRLGFTALTSFYTKVS